MNSDQDKVKITPCRNGWIVRVKVVDYYDEYVFQEYKDVDYFVKKQLLIEMNENHRK